MGLVNGALRVPGGHMGESAGEAFPRGLCVGFLMKDVRHSVGSVHLWYILLWCLDAILPASPCPPVLQFILGILDGARNKLVCWTVCCTVGEAECSLTCLHFLLWEKLWTKKVPLSTKLCCFGRKVMQVKWNCSPYPLQYFQSHTLDSGVCWNLSAGPLDFHKDPLVCGRLCKSVFFWGEDSRKLLLRHNDITL